MSQQSFFNKVKSDVYNELINFLVQNQSDITIKMDGGQYLKSKVLSKKNASELKITKLDSQQYSNVEITGLFQIQNERYFFYSHLSSTTSDWNISVPAEIFHLQRRNDFRVSVPIGLFYKCEIVYVNARKTKIECEIRDISLGGCLLSIKGKMSDLNIKQKDEIDLYLKMGKFEFLKMPLIIKHIKYVADKNFSLIGASFYDPSSDDLSDLQSMLLYLDRVHRGKEE